MIEVLLVLQVIVLGAVYLRLQRLLGRIMALTYLVYMGAFTILKPALLYYFDLYFPYSTNDYDAVVHLLTGSLLFLTIQYLAVRYCAGYRPGKVLLSWFDVSRANPRGIWLTFLVLMVVSFVGSAIKFGDTGYLLSSASAFDATMSQAGGSWYINYLAEALFYGAVLVMAYYCARMPAGRSFALLVFILVVTAFWAKLSARSGVLVLLIAWLSCSLSTSRQRSLNIFYIGAFGYLLLVILYVFNFIRLGNPEDIDFRTAAFGAVVAAASDLGPVDNATVLYSEMPHHESMQFTPLLGALTPIVLIPSAIMPVKIRPDKDSQLTKMLFPEGPDPIIYHEGGTLTFTVPASGYADAGFFGVAVASIVYAAMFCIFLGIHRWGSQSAKFVASVYMLVHVVGYRLSIESLLVSFYSTLLFFGVARWLTVALSDRRPTAAAISGANYL